MSQERNTVRANGLAVHVAQLREDAADHTAVLIHGIAGDNLASWHLTLARPLFEAGFRVVMYDLRGHGKSERPANGYALDDFVDDLAALLAELDTGYPVHLLGNSFGGTIAFGYAARQPRRVATIVAIESSPPTREWFARMARPLDRAAAYLARGQELATGAVGNGEADAGGGTGGAGQGAWAGRRAEAVRDVLTTTTLADELPASRLPAPDRITAIHCPVLCIYGGSSRVAEVGPTVHRLLPQARVAVLPGQGHSVLVDQPEQVRRLAVPWLLEHVRSGPTRN